MLSSFSVKLFRDMGIENIVGLLSVEQVRYIVERFDWEGRGPEGCDLHFGFAEV